MVALNSLFISTSDLEELLIDKNTGLPLANGQIYFYRASAQSVLKPIYQLVGSFPSYSYVALPNPLTLSAVGTIQNAGGDNVTILYYPWTPDYGSSGDPVLDLYFIKVTDSAGTVQFTRDPWPLLSESGTPLPVDQFDSFICNQISNPQFSNVFINANIPTVYTVSADTNKTFEFAPDWFFQISGTGTVTVQRIPITGSQQIVSNPPYVIDIDVGSGVTSCQLRQRFPQNSGLWSSTTGNSRFLYGSLIAKNENSGSAGIQMFYQESSGVNNITPVLVFAASFTTPLASESGFTTTAIPASTNTNSDEAGYVDIYLQFDTPSHVQFSSIQLIPSEISPVNLVVPDLDSSNRNEAFQGDYYIPRAAAKQIDSFLTGWDFPLNPKQFGLSGSVTTTPAYIMDQTIACAETTAVAWTIDPVTTGLQFNATSVNDAFYIQQYLNFQQVADMIGNRLSVNVFAYENSPTPPTNAITMQVYLLSSPLGSPIPILPTALGTVAPDGKFTPTAAGWTLVPRSGLPTAQVTLNKIASAADVNNAANDYGFTGWQIDATTTPYNFAIVVTFSYLGVGVVAVPSLTVNSISVVPGDLPCRPAVKSYQQTLRECQYYYEKSYEVNVPVAALPAAGPATAIGQIISEQSYSYFTNAADTFTYNYYPRVMSVAYKSIKRVLVTPSIYAPDGTLSSLHLNVYNSNTNTLNINTNVALANWGLTPLSTSNFIFTPPDFSTSLGSHNFTTLIGPPVSLILESIIYFQYVADARFGIVA